MGAIKSWPLLPLLIIGIVNVLACYWTVYWGLDWRIGVPTLISLAEAAGWFTTEKTWGIVLALMMPVMFIGGERHGRPWHWLIGGLFYPPILLYFLMNMAPLIAAYFFVVSAGQWVRRRQRAKRSRGTAPQPPDSPPTTLLT